MMLDRARSLQRAERGNARAQRIEVRVRIGVRMRPADADADAHAPVAVRECPRVTARRHRAADDENRFPRVMARRVQVELDADPERAEARVQLRPARQRARIAGRIDDHARGDFVDAPVALARPHAQAPSVAADRRVDTRFEPDFRTRVGGALREPLVEGPHVEHAHPRRAKVEPRLRVRADHPDAVDRQVEARRHAERRQLVDPAPAARAKRNADRRALLDDDR